MLTSICRSIVTICSGLYLLMGMTRFSSKWILSHSTWYKFRRSRQASFPQSVRSKAVPLPKLWGRHQSARHWIAMHVAQFLDALPLCPYIEIVEALLPDVLRSVVEQTVLRRIAFPFRLRQHSPRKTELERLHHGQRVLL